MPHKTLLILKVVDWLVVRIYADDNINDADDDSNVGDDDDVDGKDIVATKKFTMFVC